MMNLSFRWILLCMLIRSEIIYAEPPLLSAHAEQRKLARLTASANPNSQVSGLQLAKNIAINVKSQPDVEKIKVNNIFNTKSWYVPPPPPKVEPVKIMPPPKPTAPPMPFVFMGSYLGEDGKLIIFLSRGDRVYSVHLGDVLDNTYKVEEITASHIVMLYMPLSERQTISIGGIS